MNWIRMPKSECSAGIWVAGPELVVYWRPTEANVLGIAAYKAWDRRAELCHLGTEHGLVR